MAEVNIHEDNQWFLSMAEGHDYDFARWTTAGALQFQPNVTGKQTVVVGIIVANTSASPLEFRIYGAGSTIRFDTYVPANTTQTFFNEKGICFIPEEEVARTSSTGSGSRVVISKLV